MSHHENTQETKPAQSSLRAQQKFFEKTQGSPLGDASFQATLWDQAFRQIATGIVTIGPRRGKHQTGHFWPTDPTKVEALSALATHVSFQETQMIRVQNAHPCGDDVCFEIVEFGRTNDFIKGLKISNESEQGRDNA